MMRHVAVAIAAIAVATGLAAQAPPRVVVRDSIGRPVPYAQVQAGGSRARAANDSGIAVLSVPRADSLKLLARRVGFAAFEGWVKPDGAGEYRVELNPLPQNLNRVLIYDRDTPLARAGFYDRMERVERGAAVARFWTPEAIDVRNPNRTSVLMEGETIVKVRTMSGKPVLTGRGGSCPMGVLVDGQRVMGMVEEISTREGEEEIQDIMRRMARTPAGRGAGPGLRQAAEREFLYVRTSIDDLVNSLAVNAVEIYASMAGVPAELQRNAPSYACGLVVVWTGRRG
jgi:hypothetical protein